MSFREWWKKLDYWKKGGIIGFIFGLFIYFINYVTSGSIKYNSLLDNIIEIFSIITLNPICLPFGLSDDCFFLLFFVGWILIPIFYAIIGIVIGLIYGKTK